MAVCCRFNFEAAAVATLRPTTSCPSRLLLTATLPPPFPNCRFNFEGCRFGDLVSHYIRPKQMLCMWGQQGQCRGCEHADGA